jgi:hypothetical protein
MPVEFTGTRRVCATFGVEDRGVRGNHSPGDNSQGPTTSIPPAAGSAIAAAATIATSTAARENERGSSGILATAAAVASLPEGDGVRP